ncbi:hypothetical protein, partial [Brucella abortus]|uniref:hypothetical protein n=1 Tax=Brucella abortus TaxID=235 RepID=UPI001AEE9924
MLVFIPRKFKDLMLNISCLALFRLIHRQVKKGLASQKFPDYKRPTPATGAHRLAVRTLPFHGGNRG